MDTIHFINQQNDLNSLCRSVLYDKMKNDVEHYRSVLGYHFDFDFNYMIFRKPTNSEIILHGPGIRLREYDLLLKYLWRVSVEDYIDIKNTLYHNYKSNIKNEVETFDQSHEYCILNNCDVEHDEFLTLMTKYFQIYIIKNRSSLYSVLEYYNQLLPNK
jgi:hypothetical protein